MRPLVSVIVPAYNCALFIERALDSVWQSGPASLEVVVVDDGSEDGTSSILARYPRPIKVVRQPNRGVAAARNLGISVAAGDWLAFLDADDVWSPGKLGLQVGAAARFAEAALVFGSFRLVDAEDRRLADDAIYTYYRVFSKHHLEWTQVFDRAASVDGVCVHAGNCFRALYLGNFIKTSTVMVRKRVIEELGGFDSSLVTEEDYELWLRVALAHQVAYVDAPVVDVRRRDGQLTSGNNARLVASNVLTVVSRLAVPAAAHLSPQTLRRRLADAHRAFGEVALLEGDHRHARRALVASLQHAGPDGRLIASLTWSCLPPAATRWITRLRRPLKRSRGQRDLQA